MEDLKETIDRLIEIGGKLAEPRTIEIGGKTYSDRRMERYGKADYAKKLIGSTLTGILDYAQHIMPLERPGCSGRYFFRIVSEKCVQLVGLLDEEAEREILYDATAITTEFLFNRWIPQDEFIISLQANFVPTDDLEAIKAVSGNVQAKTVATYGDDGTTQKAVIKCGIATAEEILVPNPVSLIPYRTFNEIIQPESEFVYRIQQNNREEPEFKLVAADGDAWKLVAIARIRAYLEHEIKMRGIDCDVIG